MTFFKCVPEKQESTVYFVWGQVLFSVIHDPFASSQSLYRETLTGASFPGLPRGAGNLSEGVLLVLSIFLNNWTF